MTKFNVRDTRRTATGPIAVTGDNPTTNHQGGAGYTRDDKSDLYLLATTSHDVTADAFYEGGDNRVKRFVDLVGRTAAADPDWTYRFLTWLRTKGNMRTAAVVGGVEAARALTAAGIPGGRHMVSTVLRRADEPGEALAYHLAVHGRKLPMSVKRGVADAVTRLYNEYAVLKYDTASKGLRFADVLALTHATPDPGRPWQADLFGHIIDRRYGRDEPPVSLRTLTMNGVVRAQWEGGVYLNIGADALRAAGMTWEDVLSALGNKVDKADLWRALIPSMGFMARLRNLRNFDEAGLTDDDVKPVVDMLSDPDQVRASKQLPMRFLSAYRAAPSLRWSYPLERALDVAVENIPVLPGSTLILIDTSGSMADTLSARSDLKRWDAAVVFGLALARRCESAAVVSYSNHYRQFAQRPGASLLSEVTRWKAEGYFIGAGTATAATLRATYSGQNRVVILTDEEDGGGWGYYQIGTVTDQMPKDRPLYTFNLAGYTTSHAATDPYRLTFGGLTDAMFALIPGVERRIPGAWPWVGDPDIPALPTYPSPVSVATRSAER